MKLGSLLVAAIITASVTGALGQDKKRGESPVDAGSFGVFRNGKRVATEKFTIVQQAAVGILTAEIKMDDGTARAEQNSQMRVGSDGILQFYQWRSTVPAKEESVVEPKDELLTEHFTAADQKKRDFRYVLPRSSVILDDNFFSHRELLIWRYLATGCLPKDNQLACGASHFGVLIPRQHRAGSVTVELLGPDKIVVKGTERELTKIQIEADGVQWLLWVDDPENHYKVIRMTVPTANLEAVRE